MFGLMIVVFVFGYLMIALEHNVRIDKAASALITGGLVWTLFVFGAPELLGYSEAWTMADLTANSSALLEGFGKYVAEMVHQGAPASEPATEVASHFVLHELEHHIVDISEILFFLIGAMTIVEVIDQHEGFSVITDKIKTTNKVKLIWILSLLTFFMSAALDNLTTAIVMAALLKKLIKEKETLWIFAGVIIIAANAGGAWSPIGDVTTIMLWIGGQITASHVIAEVILPSLVTLLLPLIYLTFKLKGDIEKPEADDHEESVTTASERKMVLICGILSLLFVPVYKSITHLPPFMGVLIGLGFMWALTEILHRRKSAHVKNKLAVINVIKKVDIASVLFFLGILLAVGALQSAGHLNLLAASLDNAFNTQTESGVLIVNLIIGLLSSIVDNVPLVAGAIGMYPISETGYFAQDGLFWEFLAYCAGTGGSVLIIGSAAGVAIMGILKIDFMWYLRKISLLALLGYLGGAMVYVIEAMLSTSF